MKSLVSIMVVCGAVTSLSLLSACGDDGDSGGTGGAAGMSAGGSSAGSKASGGSAGTTGGTSGGSSSGGSSSGGTSSGGTGGGTSGGTLCADAQALADERATELDCANGGGMIEAECEALLDALPECEDEFEAAQACAEDQPAANWECNADDEADLTDGTCSEEGDALIACALM